MMMRIARVILISMDGMKSKVTVLAVVAVAPLLMACKRESKPFTEQSSGVVVFADAGVILDVGNGWKRTDVSPGPPVCPPTLVGEHGMVRAMLFAPDVFDL